MDINYKAIKQLEKKRYEILYEKGYDAISFLKKVKSKCSMFKYNWA